jgi:hypothetical protein
VARQTGISRVGNGSYSVGALVAAQDKITKANIAQLQLADFTDDIDTDFQPESHRTWAKRGSVVNLGMGNYRASILDGLIQEGHTIVEVDKTTMKPLLRSSSQKSRKLSSLSMQSIVLPLLRLIVLTTRNIRNWRRTSQDYIRATATRQRKNRESL